MKEATRSRLRIDIGMDVDLCEKVEFRFRQGSVTKDFVYPSDNCEKCSDRMISCLWTVADKAMFEHGDMMFDSRITLKDSLDQPDTGSIQTVKMRPSLFDEEEN